MRDWRVFPKPVTYVCNSHNSYICITLISCFKACTNDFSGALFWMNSRTNLLVTQPCSELHPNFRFGVEIGRQCNNDGNWSPVDMTNCTMFLNSNPVIIVYFTVIVSDSNMIDSAVIISNVSTMETIYVMQAVLLASYTHVATNRIRQNYRGGKLSWFLRFFTQSRMFSHELWPCQLAM